MLSRKLKCLFMMAICLLGTLLAAAAWADPGKSNAGQPLVTATFFDSDLKESLKEVALQCKVNISVDENVKGTVTLELQNVPLEKALQMMLIGGGFSFRKIDDFYVVGLADPKSPVFAGLCETQVYYLKNISAESAKALLPGFYEPYVRFDAATCATVIAPPDLLQKIVGDLEKIDGQKRQIRIKALVTTIQNDVLKQWGMNLFNIDFNAAGVGERTTVLNLADGLISGEGDGSFGHFSATIKALVKEKKATLQADPTVTVVEGKTGELFVGDKRTLILESPGTNATSSSTENVEAGTTLKVTPRVVGNQIELAFTQKVSRFDDEESTAQILVRSNEFNSVVRFIPGQTVLVAGLTEKNNQKNTLKTPILGDIPIVGYLFKQKSNVNGDSQLLIFLTAEVIKE